VEEMSLKTGYMGYYGVPKKKTLTKEQFIKNILDLAERFQSKFGLEPDTCVVNPSTIKVKSKEKIARNGSEITVVTAPNILPNHYWVGVEELEDRSELLNGKPNPNKVINTLKAEVKPKKGKPKTGKRRTKKDLFFDDIEARVISKDISVQEVMKRYGASKASAYRWIQEVK
jgi:hypothetical protein